jgi:hypothetical protein
LRKTNPAIRETEVVDVHPENHQLALDFDQLVIAWHQEEYLLTCEEYLSEQKLGLCGRKPDTFMKNSWGLWRVFRFKIRGFEMIIWFNCLRFETSSFMYFEKGISVWNKAVDQVFGVTLLNKEVTICRTSNSLILGVKI